MGHHYLPQFYLRGFANENRLWVHDRRERRSFSSQPKAVANENKLYSDELEQHLANEIEGPANEAIDRLRSRASLDERHRAALARYIVILWKRVPKGRARLHAVLPQVADSVGTDILAGLDAAAVREPALAQAAERRKQEVLDVLERYRESPPPAIWHQSLVRDTGARVDQALLGMRWRAFVSDGAEFLTGDNPVFFFEHEGIGNQQSELTVPFSSQVTLWASRVVGEGPFYLRARSPVIRQINRRVASQATRYLFSERNEPWILPFACRPGHTLSRIR